MFLQKSSPAVEKPTCNRRIIIFWQRVGSYCGREGFKFGHAKISSGLTCKAICLGTSAKSARTISIIAETEHKIAGIHSFLLLNMTAL